MFHRERKEGKKQRKEHIIKKLGKTWARFSSSFFFFVAPIIITFVHYLVVAAGICIDLSQYLFIY